MARELCMRRAISAALVASAALLAWGCGSDEQRATMAQAQQPAPTVTAPPPPLARVDRFDGAAAFALLREQVQE
ncbi:MAG: hypothetical protein M3N04_06290, partial [Actinomycetota bacterium]|nr:hypothetical protein [Actinomycetota bacterium]